MDFHARQYDPQIGRFLGVDPLAALEDNSSPYAAMSNMPESCIDPDGMQYQMMNKNLFNVVQASGGRNEYGTFIDGGAPQQTANGTWGEGIMGRSFAVYQSSVSGPTKSMYQMLGEAAANPGTIVSNFGVGKKDVIFMGTDQYGNSVYWYSLAKTIGVYGKGDDPNLDSWNIPYVQDGLETSVQALQAYLGGNGSPRTIGNESVKAVVNNKAFQRRHNRIISGQTNNSKGNFSVDMTKTIFHIGRTNVSYSISCPSGNCTVTYSLFEGDGFWDPDFIDEKVLGVKPDGPGPKLERFGGTPFSYNPTTISYTFKNPGY